jgi:hypothetical protein
MLTSVNPKLKGALELLHGGCILSLSLWAQHIIQAHVTQGRACVHEFHEFLYQGLHAFARLVPL